MKTTNNWGLHDLTREETMKITGGESAWYWVGYGIGAAVNAVGNAIAALVKYNQEHPGELVVYGA